MRPKFRRRICVSSSRLLRPYRKRNNKFFGWPFWKDSLERKLTPKSTLPQRVFGLICFVDWIVFTRPLGIYRTEKRFGKVAFETSYLGMSARTRVPLSVDSTV